MSDALLYMYVYIAHSCVRVFSQNEGKVTDFVSFYTLNSTVMHHPTHKLLRAAYSFYNVSSHTALPDLINDALIAAKQVCFSAV